MGSILMVWQGKCKDTQSKLKKPCRGLCWAKALAHASPGTEFLWGPRCGSEVRTKALLLLLCLPGRGSGRRWDAGVVKPEQDGCEQPF